MPGNNCVPFILKTTVEHSGIPFALSPSAMLRGALPKHERLPHVSTAVFRFMAVAKFVDMGLRWSKKVSRCEPARQALKCQQRQGIALHFTLYMSITLLPIPDKLIFILSQMALQIF